MLGYLLRRVLAAIPVMGVVALFVFLLLRLTPGDPAAILAGDNATPLGRISFSLANQIRAALALDLWLAKVFAVQSNGTWCNAAIRARTAL